MKKYTPKLDPDGIAILCNLCQGEGCHDCDFNGVELEENPAYVERQIADYERDWVW